MLKDLKLSLLVKELALFASIFTLSFIVAHRYFSAVKIVQLETGFSIWWFLLSFAVAVTIMLLIIKFVKSAILFKILMSLVMLVSILMIINAYLNLVISVIIAAPLIILYWVHRNIVVHNFVMILTISGVAIYLGLLISPVAILVLLGVLSIYDLIAVFKTKHMITMFKSLTSKGAVFGLVIPEKLAGLKAKVGGVKFGKKSSGIIMIGTGDAAFPAVLIVSSLSVGVWVSVSVAIGALVGMTAVHFILQKLKRPLPALPPIALGSALGYLVGILLFHSPFL